MVTRQSRATARERSWFEDMMGYFRYEKTAGWGHTGDIAHNFETIDFYHNFEELNNIITAKEVVLMKTTTTTDVNAWLRTDKIKSNLDGLQNGPIDKTGIYSNGKRVIYDEGTVHIYMPKANITDNLKTTWLNKLATERPSIKFEINSLEEFIK